MSVRSWIVDYLVMAKLSTSFLGGWIRNLPRSIISMMVRIVILSNNSCIETEKKALERFEVLKYQVQMYRRSTAKAVKHLFVDFNTYRER